MYLCAELVQGQTLEANQTLLLANLSETQPLTPLVTGLVRFL